MNMFEKATQQKLRFNSVMGNLTVEDLWDLPLKTTSDARASLNNVAVVVNRLLKANKEELDFISDTPKADSILELKMDILKHIIQVKLEAAEITATRKANRERNAKIREIIDQKGDATLQRKSVKELEKMLTSD